MANLNGMIDFAIGMIALFLVASLMAMALQEILAQLLSKRATHLKDAIERLLNGGTPERTNAFYNHPLISGLTTQSDGTGPSYIPRDIFVRAIKAVYLSGEAVLGASRALPDGGSLAQQVLKEAASQAEATAEDVEKALGDWFDAVMDRVSGAYKRWTQHTVLALGLAVAAAGNLDAIAVAGYLANAPAARAQFAARMSEAVGSVDKPDVNLQANILRISCENAIPVGWSQSSPTCETTLSAVNPNQGNSIFWFVLKLLGFLVTGLATTIGAAFWFDLLKRFVNIRTAGPVKQSKT